MNEQSNIATKGGVKKREQTQKLREDQMKADFKAVLGTKEGLRLFWMLLEDCNMFSSVYSQDHSHMSLLEGKRQWGIEIWSQIEQADPNAILLIMKERLAHSNQQKTGV